VDPITIGLIGFALTAAALLWPMIVRWVSEEIIPWLRTWSPDLAKIAEEALIWIDHSIAKPVRLAAIGAYRRLRQFIVSITVEFSRIAPERWQRAIKTLFLNMNNQPQMRQTTVEMSWDELPDEVRDEFIRHQKSQHVIRFTEIADRDLQLLQT
jgi:hypothetical protein